MDERYYPSENLRKELANYGIPIEKQDIVTLLDLLPKPLREEAYVYNLQIDIDYFYTVRYIADSGLKYGKRSGERLADAVAAMVVLLLQRSLITLEDK